VRACVIFNPAAKGEKARHFFATLRGISAHCELKHTQGALDARRIAAEASRQGFDTIIAAGGDGTLNEVVNGVAAAPERLEQVRVGFLPLGTVNVFARELAIPLQPEAAWQSILAGREKRIDLPCFETRNGSEIGRHYFAQMAGAGLDAAAIAAISWSLKKKIGPLAYVVAGLQAIRGPLPRITVTCDAGSATGELVLLGNGRLYGGPFRIHPAAVMDDHLLEICVFPKASVFTLVRCALPLLLRHRLPEGAVHRLRAAACQITATSPAGYEVDGELGGSLPASVFIRPRALRVIVP
jgi:YegS/Rv2252/BmrU family lipid kinase